MIQVLRGMSGVALYNSLDLNIINQNDLWDESHCATWHTKLTHATFLREQSSEFLPPWNSSEIPENSEKFIEKFEAIVEKYEDVVFGKISNIQLQDIFIRNGKSDKMLVGKSGGIEIPMVQ